MKKLIFYSQKFWNSNTIVQQEKILCAISSGQDSIVLFLVFFHLTQQSLKFVYCHHFWQKTNFFSFWHVWKLAFLFQIEIYFVLSEKKLSTENHARIWRKKSIEHIAVLSHCHRIGIGHTGTDKIETALWHLIRGSSPQGLPNLKEIEFSKANSLNTFFFYSFHKKRKTKKKFLQSCVTRFFFFCSQSKNLFLDDQVKNWNSKFVSVKTGVKRKLVVFFLEKKIEPRLYYLFSKKKDKQDNFYVSFVFQHFLIDFSFHKQRPLLVCHREDVLRIVDYYSIPAIRDKTNNLTKFSRSKIRNILFPTIRYFVNNSFDRALFQYLTLLETKQKGLKSKLKKKDKNEVYFHIKQLFFDAYKLDLNYSQLQTLAKTKRIGLPGTRTRN